MPRIKNKKAALEKESTINNALNLKAGKIPQQEDITCKHCLSFSGFTNSDLAKLPITAEKEIKCLNCGENCINIKKTIGYAVPLYTVFSDIQH